MSNIVSDILSYLTDALYILPVVFISLTFHECAHGLVAYKLGDPTAKNAGRLTLNPLKHIDPLGLIMMIIVRFGWAKPVPVNPMYFKEPKKGMMYTAIAGPISNLLLAIVSSFFTVFFTYAQDYSQSEILGIIYMFFLYMTLINIGLAVFNLIPVYPLDGSRIFGYFLPEKINDFFRRYGQYIYIAFFVLVISTNFIGDAIYTVQVTIYSGLFYIWKVPVTALAGLIFGFGGI